MAKIDKGDVLVCGLCGLAVMVCDGCGCSSHELVCCGKPMKRKARKSAARKPAKRAAKKKKPVRKAKKR